MTRYYAVIDTNVLISSMLKHDSMPGQVIDYVLLGKIIPLLNNEIMDEYKEVMTRNKFGFSEADVDELLLAMQSKGVVLDRKRSDETLADEDDVVFYEIALSGRSTMAAYLVTGNLKHYPIRNFVVTPRQMIDIIESDT